MYLSFYLHISNIIKHNCFFFVNHFAQDFHCWPKHVAEMSYIHKPLPFILVQFLE
jgi:hypothetical protein